MLSEFLSDINDTQAVIAAIENNTAEFLLAMGKAGGGEEKRSDEITWTIGGSPIDYHNAVVHTNLSPANVDSAIREVIEQLTAHQVPGTWHIGPSMRPDDLGARLESYGFKNGGTEPGMAAYLPELNTQGALPNGFRVERVRDREMLKLWTDALAVSFGEGPREANWVADVYGKIGLGDDVPWRHYMGWIGADPVGTSSVYLGAGVAGIYFVSTIPTMRQRGIGAAMTLAPLQDALAMGYQVGVLGASEPGVPVYERLGFRTYCHFTLYEWQPV
jgi:GNAT superfamily N-acetyltransferase